MPWPSRIGIAPPSERLRSHFPSSSGSVLAGVTYRVDKGFHRVFPLLASSVQGCLFDSVSVGLSEPFLPPSNGGSSYSQHHQSTTASKVLLQGSVTGRVLCTRRYFRSRLNTATGSRPHLDNQPRNGRARLTHPTIDSSPAPLEAAGRHALGGHLAALFRPS